MHSSDIQLGLAWLLLAQTVPGIANAEGPPTASFFVRTCQPMRTTLLSFV